MRKKLALLALLVNSAFSSSIDMREAIESCNLPYEVMYSIAQTESGYRDGGYEFVIGVNNSTDIDKAKQLLKGYNGEWIENKTFDCKNKDNCISASKALINARIVNIDMGAFQINYKWHKEHLSTGVEAAFILPEAYVITCDLVNECIKTYGYNWKGISCYHSRTPDRNIGYANKLAKVINKTFNTQEGDENK